MSVIGETLRSERLERKLGLEDVSRELKISQRFLEAIEEERWDALPRGVFAKSFVRQYARFLGLDEEELASEVQRAIEPSSEVPGFAGHTPEVPPSEIRVPRVEAWENVSDGRTGRSSALPALALVVVVMLVCSGIYAVWQRANRPAPPREETAAEVPSDRLPHNQASAPASAPVVATPQPSVSQTPSTQTPTADSAIARPPQQNPAPTNPTATAPGSQPAAIPPPPSASRVQTPPSNPNATVRVTVTADELVWVLARTDGKYAFSGTLEANQSRTFDGESNVLLRLGNAGGVSIMLNGKPVGAVGPKGQVRTVQFTSGGFQIVAVPKPSLPLNDLF